MMTLGNWLGYSKEYKKELIEHYGFRVGLTGEQVQSLSTSLPIVIKFLIEAHDIARVRSHYSARTIIEVIRHNSALEDSDKTFKINNNITKPLAKISMEMFPALNGLFEIRSHTFSKEH